MSVFDSPDFNSRLFFPRPDRSPCPAGATDLQFEAAPSVMLHARRHRAAGTRGTCLLFHGNGEVVADYDAAAAQFQASGVDLVVFDFRGYGESGGVPSLRDVMADALAFARSLKLDGPRFVFGRSLGAMCAAELGGAGFGDGVIIESGVGDLQTLLARRGIQSSLSEDELVQFDPKRKWARCTVPALVLHGEEDRTISLAEGRSTFEALASKEKRWVPLAGVGHNDISWSPGYWPALRSFFGVVRSAPHPAGAGRGGSQ